jgi:universal stress protein A
MEDIRRILVVTRSTKYCQKAVHYAVSLSRKYGAEIVILPELEKEYDDIFKNAKTDLDRIIAAEKATGLPIKELIVEGDPIKKIFQVVKEEKIDLIVMLAYEQWKIEHWLFGRGTDEIIRRIPCSVLLVQKKIGELDSHHVV